MTACMKANSQRVIFTKSGAVTTKRVDDHSPFAHILYHNPFPPRHKFAVVIEKAKKAKAAKPKPEDDLHTARKTSSNISLLEGTMSLTSMSSHSQLSATTPSHPINLKTPKKRSNRFRQQPPDSQMKHAKPKTPPSKSPKGTSDENRLMNTFNTSE
ncbi:hypothetical protein CAEBREN_02282 [Caenorhabditis brenneri]|uniref:Uncharacterized protein n=1 Tax=Caenorhabditis brenneri TaxID=135651 RepID=G0NFK5_CAEBE|nr:hypothetical protein CAEBREN_02282 [Caenorhabditis brenneri]